MDIAELRKKANAGQGPAEAARPLPTQPMPEMGEAAPAESGAADQDDFERGSEAMGPVQDPVDALFAYPRDIALVTEGTYLQGLEEKQKISIRNSLQWLTFSLGKEQYALDIEKISEIIKPREITELPRVPGFILGIISLRGVVVPIFDLKQRLNLGAAQIGLNSRIVVCQQEDRQVGLLVDRINQVVRMAQEEIEPPPANLSGIRRDLVEGVGRHQQKIVILLNLENVMNAELT